MDENRHNLKQPPLWRALEGLPLKWSEAGQGLLLIVPSSLASSDTEYLKGTGGYSAGVKVERAFLW